MEATQQKKTNKEMLLTGSILVRPHLYKFLCWSENIAPGEPIRLVDNGSNIAFILQMLLGSKLNNISYDKRQSVGEDYTATLSYVYPLRHLNQGHIFVDEKAILIFNRYLHKQFHETLLTLILQNQKYEITIDATIKGFMETIGIYDEIEFDSLKKANYRLRLSKKIEMNDTRTCKAV